MGEAWVFQRLLQLAAFPGAETVSIFCFSGLAGPPHLTQSSGCTIRELRPREFGNLDPPPALYGGTAFGLAVE